MEYDRQLTIGTDNIASHLKVEAIKTFVGNSLKVDTTVSLLDNLPDGLLYDLNLSYLSLNLAFNNHITNTFQSELVYITISSGYIVTYLGNNLQISLPFNPSQVFLYGPPVLKLKGRIYLNNNTFFIINKDLVTDTTFINTYYNPTN